MEKRQIRLITQVKGGGLEGPWGVLMRLSKGWPRCRGQGRQLGEGGGTSRPRQMRTWLHEGEGMGTWGSRHSMCKGPEVGGREGWAAAQRMRWCCGVGGDQVGPVGQSAWGLLREAPPVTGTMDLSRLLWPLHGEVS